MTLFANVAVPLYFPQPLLTLAALLPVIAIEGLLLRRQTTVRWQDVSVANVLSTLLGVPLAFVCATILASVSGMVLDKNGGTFSHVLLVLLVVTIPCLGLSVFLEGCYLRSRVGEIAERPFWMAVAKVHIHSYLTLLVVYCAWISMELSELG